MTLREAAILDAPDTGAAGEAVIASDMDYFELGAQVESVAGACLAWMPGLTDIPAGCVVVDAEAWRQRADPGQELDAAEERVRALGGRVRLYLRGRAPALEAVMRRRGYSWREEICLVLRGDIADPLPVAIEPVEDAGAWDIKGTLHARSPDSPDGHEVAPARKVELERRKVATGKMRAWLIREPLEGVVAGTVCTLEHGGILRMKNLLVDRERRCRGIGSGAMAALAAIAGQAGKELGIVALHGAPTWAMYRRPQVVPVARWIEWLAPAEVSGPGEAR